jgi:hypothetical protein
MSVWVGDTMRAHNPRIEPANLVDGHEGFLASLLARQVREEGQGVIRTPRTEPPPHVGDPAHGDVIGKKNSGKRTRMAECSVWVVEPSDDLLPSTPDEYG